MDGASTAVFEINLLSTAYAWSHGSRGPGFDLPDASLTMPKHLYFVMGSTEVLPATRCHANFVKNESYQLN